MSDQQPREFSRRTFLKEAGVVTGGLSLAATGLIDILPNGNSEPQTLEAIIQDPEFRAEIQASAEDLIDSFRGTADNLGNVLSKIDMSIDAESGEVKFGDRISSYFESLQKAFDEDPDNHQRHQELVSEAVTFISDLDPDSHNEEHETEHGHDPNARMFDRLGTAYFIYALGKLTAQGIPGANRWMQEALVKYANQDKFEKDIPPHFNKVDYAVSGAILVASLESANINGDHERVHELQHGIQETVVASAKVGIDIALSIVNADIFKPIVDGEMKKIIEKADGDQDKKRNMLYWAIHKYAAVGSGLLSTNLGVSLARDMIWEYAKVDDELTEDGKPVYDMNMVYFMTAMVADLTGDVALANAIIAAGDIAPREIAQFNLGINNLHRMSLNAIPARLVNMGVGFKTVISAIGYAREHDRGVFKDRHGNIIENTVSVEDSIARFSRSMEEIPAESEAEIDESVERLKTTGDRLTASEFVNRAKDVIVGYGRGALDRIAHYPHLVKKNHEHYSHRRNLREHVNGVPLSRILLMKEAEMAGVDLSDHDHEVVDAYRHFETHGYDSVDTMAIIPPHHSSELSVMIEAIRKIPVVGDKVSDILAELEALVNVAFSYENYEHTLHHILADAMNVLPYQLLNTPFVAGVVKHDLNSFRTAELTDPVSGDSSLIDIALENQTMHFALMLLSGFADNGFSMSVDINSILADAQRFLADGKPIDQVRKYVTLEIQKGYSASQAGGMGSMVGCSAHYNNLSLAVQDIIGSSMVGIPASIALYIQMTIVNSLIYKFGIMNELDLNEIPKLESALAEAVNNQQEGQGLTRADFFRMFMGQRV
ncbi:MAG: hypothetical protein QY330_01065 [Candidatus Dojkabacteria bacterium]|nr:MAG: hypothetical protein QY330_01065 [Candidatus Dojkabacteria bacterium]